MKHIYFRALAMWTLMAAREKGTHTHTGYTHPTQPPTHTQHVWVREKEDRQFM